MSVDDGLRDELRKAVDEGRISAEESDRLLAEAEAEQPPAEQPEAPAGLPSPATCPVCLGDGVLPFDSEGRPLIEPRQDPHAQRCSDCGGLGMVLTGSLVPEYTVRPCSRCGSTGFEGAHGATVVQLPAGEDAGEQPAPLPDVSSIVERARLETEASMARGA